MSNEFKAVKQKFLRVWLNVKCNLSFSSGGIVPSKTLNNFKLPIRGERIYKVTKCIQCDNPAYQQNGKVYKLCARYDWEAIKEVCELNEIEEE